MVAGGEIAGRSVECGGEVEQQAGERLPPGRETREKNACELVDAFGDVCQCTRADDRRTV
jgi:hypothetical protein